MTTYKIVQTVEEIYYIEANTKEEAVEVLYAGFFEPTEFGDMIVDSIDLYMSKNKVVDVIRMAEGL